MAMYREILSRKLQMVYAKDLLDQLFRGHTDVDGCIALMDEARMAAAAAQGAEGF